MLKISEVIIVEGIYDKIKLDSICDCLIIPTHGFSIFSDKEKLMLIKKLAKKKGIIILTDSDSAGFKIRSFLKGQIDNKYIKHAYIPDILGKEKRKAKASSEGLIGVEGVDVEILKDALLKAGINVSKSFENERKITKNDLYIDGLWGRDNSSFLREKLANLINIPKRLSTNALVDLLNKLYTYDEYKEIVLKISNGN